MHTKEVGAQAEQLAAQELVRQGYTIAGRNWRTKFCEIDIIAVKNGCAYFAEVKYRSSNGQGDGFDYITPQKLHHMQRAAEAWVRSAAWQGEVALLAVAVDKTGSVGIVEL
jgi:Holliday junction resolvase-like predicted endonuclease